MQGSLAELRELLSTRTLPRSTLIWFDPWPEWRPATRVPELASALPPSRSQKSTASRSVSKEPAPKLESAPEVAPEKASSVPRLATVDAVPRPVHHEPPQKAELEPPPTAAPSAPEVKAEPAPAPATPV